MTCFSLRPHRLHPEKMPLAMKAAKALRCHFVMIREIFVYTLSSENATFDSMDIHVFKDVVRAENVEKLAPNDDISLIYGDHYEDWEHGIPLTCPENPNDYLLIFQHHPQHTPWLRTIHYDAFTYIRHGDYEEDMHLRKVRHRFLLDIR